jgi:5-methylcytosine-specific restriction protein A
MPKRPPRPCAVSGCNALVYDGSRCQQHRLPRPRDPRPNSTERGYGYDWKTKVRDPYLRAHPWCANPYKTHDDRVSAVVVDHVIPKKQGGSDDWSNLQGLCRRCDNKKHYRDGSKRDRG